MQCLFFEQTRRNIAGSNKPNTLSANFSLIYISERVIKQWCEIHANYPTESNKTSIIICHLNNQSFSLVCCGIRAARLRFGSCCLLVNISAGRAGAAFSGRVGPACVRACLHSLSFKMLYQRRLNRTRDYIVLFFNGMRNCIFFPPRV